MRSRVFNTNWAKPSGTRRFTYEVDGRGNTARYLFDTITTATVQRIHSLAREGYFGPLHWLYERMAVSGSRYGGHVAELQSKLANAPLKPELAFARNATEEAIAALYMEIAEEQLRHVDTRRFNKMFLEVDFKGTQVFENGYDLVFFPGGRAMNLVGEIRPVSFDKMREVRTAFDTNYGKLVYRPDPKDREQVRTVDSLGKWRIWESSIERPNGKRGVMGLAHKCVPWWILKQYAAAWWGQYQQLYGQPIRIATLPSNGGTQETRDILKQFLEDLGQHAYGMFPAGTETQIINAASSSSINGFADLIEMCNQEISMVMAGQSETASDNRFGSRAKATVSNGIRYERFADHAATIANCWQYIFCCAISQTLGEDKLITRLVPKVRVIISNTNTFVDLVSSFDTLNSYMPVAFDTINEHLGLNDAKPEDLVVYKRQLMTRSEAETYEESHGTTEQGPSAVAEEPVPDGDEA